MKQLRSPILGVALACLMASPALAVSGADAVKQLNRDDDKTLDIAEALAGATTVFNALNKDPDLTLDKAETKGIVTEAEWKKANRDHDQTLELDEWFKIVRARFNAADADHDGTLSAAELDSPKGQSLLKLIIKP